MMSGKKTIGRTLEAWSKPYIRIRSGLDPNIKGCSNSLSKCQHLWSTCSAIVWSNLSISQPFCSFLFSHSSSSPPSPSHQPSCNINWTNVWSILCSGYTSGKSFHLLLSSAFHHPLAPSSSTWVSHTRSIKARRPFGLISSWRSFQSSLNPILRCRYGWLYGMRFLLPTLEYCTTTSLCSALCTLYRRRISLVVLNLRYRTILWYTLHRTVRSHKCAVPAGQ